MDEKEYIGKKVEAYLFEEKNKIILRPTSKNNIQKSGIEITINNPSPQKIGEKLLEAFKKCD